MKLGTRATPLPETLPGPWEGPQQFLICDFVSFYFVFIERALYLHPLTQLERGYDLSYGRYRGDNLP